jgi:hypothetical protein
MSKTKYELYRENLDSERISREINVSEEGPVIARGVSAPYEGAPTPCVEETYRLDEPALRYVFTDALTGCAGLIAVSGDVSPTTSGFTASKALVIHDKGGDSLVSSQKLLEDFIISQSREGHTRMRLVWGNGVVREAVDPSHTFATTRMIHALAQKYPHLEIKHLPNQMALIVDKNGNPINIADTALSQVPRMEVICQGEQAIDIQSRVDLNFERGFQRDFTPPETVVRAPSPVDQINVALSKGKFPPTELIQTDETMKVYLNNVTAKIPTSGADASHYRELTAKIKDHPNPVVQEIGKQIEDYKIKYMQNSYGTSPNLKKAELMSRKWWAMLCMANELMEGLEGKPVRKQLFDKQFFTTWIPRSMEGTFSTKAASLVEKVDKEFLLSKKLSLIDGIPSVDSAHQTREQDATAQAKQRSESDLRM